MIRPVMAYMLFSVYCFDRNWEIFLVAINKNSMNITHYQFTQSQVTEIRRVRSKLYVWLYFGDSWKKVYKSYIYEVNSSFLVLNLISYLTFSKLRICILWKLNTTHKYINPSISLHLNSNSTSRIVFLL